MNSTKIQSYAFVRAVRVSPSKARRIVDQIRNTTYFKALILILHMPEKTRDPIRKVLNSAAANAVDRFGVPKKNLIIQEIRVDEGPTMKRFQPRAQGRAFPIHKQTSHIHIKLGCNNN